MKKIFISLFFIFISNILFALSIEVSINNVTFVSNINDMIVNMELQYCVLNSSDEDIFLYDLNHKNQYHYEEDNFLDGIATKKIFVFKPLYNDWSGSWGYNPHYPKFSRILPGQKSEGKISLNFKIPKNENPLSLAYSFNFIFAKEDITKCLSNFNSNELTDIYLFDEFINFTIKKENLINKF